MVTDPPISLDALATLPSPAWRAIPPAAPAAESPVVILIDPLAVPVTDPVVISTAPLDPDAPEFCVANVTLPLVN